MATIVERIDFDCPINLMFVFIKLTVPVRLLISLMAPSAVYDLINLEANLGQLRKVVSATVCIIGLFPFLLLFVRSHCRSLHAPIHPNVLHHMG